MNAIEIAPGVWTSKQVDYFDRIKNAIIEERAVKANEIKIQRRARTIKLRGINPIFRPFLAPFIKTQ